MPVDPAHPNLIPLPSQQSTVWRFMSLGKFLSLFSTGSLYFTQLFAMREQDPFEGQYSKVNVLLNKKFNEDDEFAKAVMKNDDMKVIQTIRNLGAAFGSPQWADHIAKVQYVNCWHLNPVEPSGFWKLYSDLEQGVAVKSNLARLVDAFAFTSQSIQVGRIKYIDYEQHQIETGNLLHPTYRKRKNFEFEDEVRLTIISGEQPGSERPGIVVTCDLERLISEVVVGPNSPSWVFDSIRRTVKSFGYNITVSRSVLFSAPDYL